jgi:peptidoglycan-associated lipoprotein
MTLARLAEGALLALGAVDLMVLNLHLAPQLAPPAPQARVAIAATRPPPPAPPSTAAVLPSPSPSPSPTEGVVAAAASAPAGRVKAMEDIHFDLDLARIDGIPAIRELGRIARELDAHPERRVIVRGHSDRMGSPEHNYYLSRRRALAVEGVLVTHGVARERITVEVLGSSEPVAVGNTPAAWAQNRRVEVFWR